MKICQVCPYDIDRPGGVQWHIRDSAAELVRLGHDVTIISPKVWNSESPREETNASGVRFFRVGMARSIRFAGTAFETSIALGPEHHALSQFLANSGFNVIHYHTMWTPFLPFQVFALSKTANVATFHDTPPESATGICLDFVFRNLSRALLPRLDGVITVSESPVKHLQSAAAGKLHILPPCTNLSSFFAVPPDKPVDGRAMTILFLGRLEPRKGASVLLQAYRQLKSDGLPVRLSIAGTGSEEQALRNYVSQYDVPDVEFLGSFPMGGAAKLYEACDIFCAPSLSGESFGIVIAEAMASGRPVIAAANSGYRTVLIGQGAEMLVPPGDSHALYRKLSDLVRDKTLRDGLAVWGRENAIKYDCKTVVPEFLAIYESATKKRKSG